MSRQRTTYIAAGALLLASVIAIFSLRSCRLGPTADNAGYRGPGSESGASDSLYQNERNPVFYAQILPPDRHTPRRAAVQALARAVAAGDFRTAAALNSALSQSAFLAAHRVMTAWEQRRDPETGLLPWSLDPRMQFWVPEDNGADFWPFLLMTALYLDEAKINVWSDAIHQERRICGPLPCKILFQPARPQQQDLYGTFFGATEYMKDGLQAITERFGKDGPWYKRHVEIMNRLMRTLPPQPGTGRIVSEDCEPNGNLLQVVTRLYWATKDEAYLKLAEGVAETYLFDIFPVTNYIPPRFWNFTKRQPSTFEARIRDHGSELIGGLSELYFLESKLNRPQAARYRKPLMTMLDNLLKAGRTAEGLWINFIDIRTLTPMDREFIDTWGYILNAYQTFDLAEGTHRYENETRRTLRAVSKLKSYPWEGQQQDGYADSIESMLYLLPWFDLPECHAWVDDEFEILLAKQAPSGFVEEWYLDGNFARTALLYATYKTQGVLAKPWREDVQVGAIQDGASGQLYLHVSSQRPWSGVLAFDLPRHRTIWNMPSEYPRLNGTPEWFVVEPDQTYCMETTGKHAQACYQGRELSNGLPVTLSGERDAFTLRLWKKPTGGPGT